MLREDADAVRDKEQPCLLASTLTASGRGRFPKANQRHQKEAEKKSVMLKESEKDKNPRNRKASFLHMQRNSPG